VPAGTATRRHRFQPYQFAEHAIELTPTWCALDDQRALGVVPDIERHLLDLSSQRYQRARLSLSLTVAPALLAAVFPAGELDAPPARLAILLRCPATRLRVAVGVAGPPVRGGTYTAAVELRRADLSGAVELGAVLIRDVARSGPEDGFASFAGAKLADARPWELRIDAVRPVHGQYLDVRYEDFRAAGVGQFPRPDALYQLDCDGEAPILWLNLAQPRICSSLDSVATTGHVARLRDVVFERIQHAVWSRLVIAAARDVTRLGEPAFAWQEPVLRTWLPRLYPDAGDHDSRVAALGRELDDGDVAALLGRLDGLLQDEHDTARCLDLLAEEIES
jgi:hypothetical protein